MITVLYSKFNPDASFNDYNQYLTLLPDKLISDVLRYKQDKDKIARLLSKLLFREALTLYGYPLDYLSKIQFTKYKRPFISGNLDFNITHSGEYVVIAASTDGTTGIDIEKIKPLEFEAFEKYMTSEEWQKIQNTPNCYAQFFEHWTKKESIIKADGRGLYVPLQEIYLDTIYGKLGKNTWYLSEIKINPDYKCYLASAIDKESIHTKEIVFNMG